jgi:hypothetical protein
MLFLDRGGTFPPGWDAVLFVTFGFAVAGGGLFGGWLFDHGRRGRDGSGGRGWCGGGGGLRNRGGRLLRYRTGGGRSDPSMPTGRRGGRAIGAGRANHESLTRRGW